MEDKHSSISNFKFSVNIINGALDEKYTSIGKLMHSLCKNSMHHILNCGHNVHLEEPILYSKIVKNILKRKHMKRIEKSRIIGKILDDLYPKTPIPLDHKDPYTLLVAVMLSAQTTDKKVNQVTPKLFKYADTPEKMANLEIDFIKNLIQEIGLAPTKAKNLNKMAKQIIKEGE